MDKTRIVSYFLNKRRKEINKYDVNPEDLQTKVLINLTKRAQHTEWGHSHNYNNIKNYNEFANSTPINSYEELKGYIERMRRGERDVLWPGLTKWYAKSSGTTNDKSKFIPVTKDSLKDTHYRGGTDVVAMYLGNNPNSKMFDGKALKQDRDIMKRFNDIAGVYGNPIIIGNKTVSFPEEYSAEFTNEEILRLKEMILKNREVFKNGSVHTNKFVTVRNRKQNTEIRNRKIMESVHKEPKF